MSDPCGVPDRSGLPALVLRLARDPPGRRPCRCQHGWLHGIKSALRSAPAMPAQAASLAQEAATLPSSFGDYAIG